MYSVYYTASSSKDWKHIPSEMIPALRKAIECLAFDPRPHQSERLVTMRNAYRIRKGDYRVLYTVDDSSKVVVVYKIAHRRESYR